MTRPANFRAIATKDSIANLCAAAERDGEVVIRVDSERAAYTIRNKFYKHRDALRKQAMAHLGIEATNLDAFKFTYRAELVGYSAADPVLPTGKFICTLSYHDEVEFELMLPDDVDEKEYLADFHFDTTGGIPLGETTPREHDDEIPF